MSVIIINLKLLHDIQSDLSQAICTVVVTRKWSVYHVQIFFFAVQTNCCYGSLWKVAGTKLGATGEHTSRSRSLISGWVTYSFQ